MRYANKRDAAERSIIEALVAVGCKVEQLDYPCDLATQFRGRDKLLEVKTGRRKPDARQKAQQAFLRDWNIPVVRTPAEALLAIGACKLPGERPDRDPNEYTIRLAP